MEHAISVNIEIEVNTTKGSASVCFDNYFDAAEYLLGELTDEQKKQLCQD